MDSKSVKESTNESISSSGSELRGKRDKGEPINLEIKKHAARVEDWKYHDIAKELYRCAEMFHLEFKLQIPQPVIALDKARGSVLATYRVGRSGFGTKYTITINTEYLNDPFYRVLRRLLHEIIHQWQELFGKLSSRPSYHNKQFIQKALACGIMTDHWGHDLGHTKVFSDLLLKYGVNVPEIEGEPVIEERKGNSKMKKWSCGCTNVRCAVDLHAQCLKCGDNFVKEER